MSNIFTKKDIKRTKKAMKRDSRYSLTERKRSTESLDNLVGVRKSGAQAQKILKSSKLSVSDRKGVSDLLNSNKKSTISSANASGKAKTGWWKNTSSGSSSNNQGTSKAGRSGGVFSGFRSKSSNVDKLRNELGTNKVGFTSGRGNSTAPRKKTSIGGLRKLY